MSSKLKEAREEAGYSIEEVAKKLNIRKQYLICLEEENFNDIPGPVYVEGYTKMYCELLGINYSNQNNQSSKKTKIISNKQIKLNKRYVVVFSILMLSVVIWTYSFITNKKDNIVENKIIQNIQDHDGNNEKEFNQFNF